MYGQPIRVFFCANFMKFKVLSVSVLVCDYAVLCLLYVCHCVFANVGKRTHVRLCAVTALQICEVQLEDFEAKQVAFGAADRADKLCFTAPVFGVSSCVKRGGKRTLLLCLLWCFFFFF